MKSAMKDNLPWVILSHIQSEIRKYSDYKHNDETKINDIRSKFEMVSFQNNHAKKLESLVQNDTL